MMGERRVAQKALFYDSLERHVRPDHFVRASAALWTHLAARASAAVLSPQATANTLPTGEPGGEVGSVRRMMSDSQQLAESSGDSTRRKAFSAFPRVPRKIKWTACRKTSGQRCTLTRPNVCFGELAQASVATARGGLC